MSVLTQKQIEEAYASLAKALGSTDIAKTSKDILKIFQITKNAHLCQTDDYYNGSWNEQPADLFKSATIPYIKRTHVGIDITDGATIVLPDLETLHETTIITGNSALKAPRLTTSYSNLSIIESSLEAPKLAYVEDMTILAPVSVDFSNLMQVDFLYAYESVVAFNNLLTKAIFINRLSEVSFNSLTVGSIIATGSIVSIKELNNIKGIRRITLSEGSSLILPARYEKILSELDPDIFDISEDSNIFYMED